MAQIPDTLIDRFLSGWSVGIATMDNAFGVKISLCAADKATVYGMHIDEAKKLRRILSMVINMAEQLNRERPD